MLLFFTLQPHPTSTLFPYTTLFRSTVEENLRFAARLWDLPRRVAEPRIDRLLSQFGLDGRRREPVRALSGGDRKSTRLTHSDLVCRLLLEKKKQDKRHTDPTRRTST